MSIHKSPIANLVLITLASLSGVVNAKYEDEVWAALDILNTFDPYNAEPFCANFIEYEPSTTKHWITDAPVTVTTTLPCSSAKTGYETGITTAPKPSDNASYGPGYGSKGPTYPSNSTAYPSYGPGYQSSIPAYESSIPAYQSKNPDVITILTTTTITYTTTSTIYVPAATKYPEHPAYPTLAARDIFCDEYNVPCRLVQYSPEVIADACGKYLDQSAITPSVTDHVTAPTVTVTAENCGYSSLPLDSYETDKPDDKPADEDEKPEYPGGEDHEEEPSEEYPGGEDNGEDADATEGDGEDATDSSYDNPVGDGEDVPDEFKYGPEGDGEDVPDDLHLDGVGDGEDVPDAPEQEGEDDGTE